MKYTIMFIVSFCLLCGWSDNLLVYVWFVIVDLSMLIYSAYKLKIFYGQEDSQHDGEDKKV